MEIITVARGEWWPKNIAAKSLIRVLDRMPKKVRAGYSVISVITVGQPAPID